MIPARRLVNGLVVPGIVRDYIPSNVLKKIKKEIDTPALRQAQGRAGRVLQPIDFVVGSRAVATFVR